MEVEHILTNKCEFINTLSHQQFNDVSLQCHDVVVQKIIPFSNKFYYRETNFVIDIKDFDEKGRRAHVIPLRVEYMVVKVVCKLELTVLAIEKGRTRIFRCSV